ncbi:hypothetical protein AAFF_G00210290 [Aldrovandia affinis]|uniref:ribonuclease H n=1 Tax=Aldrovandia affinis TaxID=143900 RepID=A0AAD7SWK4_9TELE|nr:hypothetical protein AAFF_G00210290 [Aldrovandia affinis]
MPFGIKPAAEEYQRRQHEVLQGLRGISVIADDILVYGSGETTEEAVKDHDNNISALLQRAREVNLKLNKWKLRLKLPSVTYMGHLLTTEGLRPDPEKLFAQEWDFNHETSSPYNSQSNGKAESAVKIAKTLLKKAALDGGDPWKAVLAWRNTPTEGLDSSPVQRLMSR